MMLEGDFTVSSGEVEVEKVQFVHLLHQYLHGFQVIRRDGREVSEGMSEWCSARCGRKKLQERAYNRVIIVLYGLDMDILS